MTILNSPHPEGEEDRVKGSTGWRMPRVSLRSTLLGGVLDAFLARQCAGDCPPDGCSHCRDYADAAVDFDPAEVEEAISHLNMLRERMVGQ